MRLNIVRILFLDIPELFERSKSLIPYRLGVRSNPSANRVKS